MVMLRQMQPLRKLLSGEIFIDTLNHKPGKIHPRPGIPPAVKFTHKTCAMDIKVNYKQTEQYRAFVQAYLKIIANEPTPYLGIHRFADGPLTRDELISLLLQMKANGDVLGDACFDRFWLKPELRILEEGLIEKVLHYCRNRSGRGLIFTLEELEDIHPDLGYIHQALYCLKEMSLIEVVDNQGVVICSFALCR